MQMSVPMSHYDAANHRARSSGIERHRAASSGIERHRAASNGIERHRTASNESSEGAMI
jgi:hypothetical protein